MCFLVWRKCCFCSTMVACFEPGIGTRWLIINAKDGVLSRDWNGCIDCGEALRARRVKIRLYLIRTSIECAFYNRWEIQKYNCGCNQIHGIYLDTFKLGVWDIKPTKYIICRYTAKSGNSNRYITGKLLDPSSLRHKLACDFFFFLNT